MLKRKWIIDNAGRLLGVWIDSSQPSVAPAYRNEHSILKTVHAAEPRNRVGRGWFHHRRFGDIVACLILSMLFVVFLIGVSWADVGGKITGTVKGETEALIPGATVAATVRHSDTFMRPNRVSCRWPQSCISKRRCQSDVEGTGPMSNP